MRDHRVLDRRVRDSDAAVFKESWGVPTHGAVEHPLGPDGPSRHGPCQKRKGRAGPARGSTGPLSRRFAAAQRGGGCGLAAQPPPR